MLTIESLTKSFPGSKKEKKSGRVMAVDGVSFAVEAGELFTMLGPSGCGKTTTLRCIAGLEKPDSGSIMVAERTMYSSEHRIRLRANERGLGMVFQSYAIWPHLNVHRNVAFPLEVLPRRQRPSKKEIRTRVERVLEAVQLGDLGGRQATDLSGGQQQRLALARALVMEPPLLLLDEPLSNLDAQLRDEMRFELKRLQSETGITTVYVTHDQTEALAMSNKIAVMRKGRIEQLGTPREIYERPKSHFVADFIGTSNFIDGVVETQSEDGTLYDVSTAHGRISASASDALPAGTRVVVSVRPEHVLIEKDPGSSVDPGVWRGTVTARAFLGEAVDHVVQVGAIEIRSRTNPSVSIPPGTDVKVSLPQEMCAIIPAGREQVSV